MGLGNIREVSGSVTRALFGGLSLTDFVAEWRTPNRQPSDYASSVELGRYVLTTWVGESDTAEEFVIPVSSHGTIERMLEAVRTHPKQRDFLRKALPFAHEFLSNPQVLALCVEYMRAWVLYLRPEEREDSYSWQRTRVQQELTETQIHLAAGELHLFHRRDQWGANPALRTTYDG